MANELAYFDAFYNVPNRDLEEVYFQAIREEDPDLPLIEQEMVKRGLLGHC